MVILLYKKKEKRCYFHFKLNLYFISPPNWCTHRYRADQMTENDAMIQLKFHCRIFFFLRKSTRRNWNRVEIRSKCKNRLTKMTASIFIEFNSLNQNWWLNCFSLAHFSVIVSVFFCYSCFSSHFWHVLCAQFVYKLNKNDCSIVCQ